MGKTTGDGKRESKSTINTSKGAHKEDYSTPLKEDMGRKTRKVKTTQSVPGLVNTGNTCWLNASIQALAAVPSCYLAGKRDDVCLNLFKTDKRRFLTISLKYCIM